MKRVSALTRYRHVAKDAPAPDRIHSGPVISPSLALPEGATISRTALILPTNLALEDWKALGTNLAKFGNGIQWWIGDWWHFGHHRYGERKAAVMVATAKGIFPRTFETVMNWACVAGKVTTSLRNEVLSWSHHVAVAPYEPKYQKKWLAAAERNKWKVWQLHRHINEQLEHWDDKDREAMSDEERALDDARGYADELLEAAQEHMVRWSYLFPLDRKRLELLSSGTIAKLAKEFTSAAAVWGDANKIIQQVKSQPATARPKPPAETRIRTIDEKGNYHWRTPEEMAAP